MAARAKRTRLIDHRRLYDPPVSEPDQHGRPQLKSREQRLKTVEVLTSMYGETESLRAARSYLLKQLNWR